MVSYTDTPPPNGRLFFTYLPDSTLHNDYFFILNHEMDVLYQKSDPPISQPPGQSCSAAGRLLIYLYIMKLHCLAFFNNCSHVRTSPGAQGEAKPHLKFSAPPQAKFSLN